MRTANQQDPRTVVTMRALAGPWRQFTPYQRQRLLPRLAELLEENSEEFAVLESCDMGRH
jgi:aldehyde dehydrogenase (NAD+)